MVFTNWCLFFPIVICQQIFYAQVWALNLNDWNHAFMEYLFKHLLLNLLLPMDWILNHTKNLLLNTPILVKFHITNQLEIEWNFLLHILLFHPCFVTYCYK